MAILFGVNLVSSGGLKILIGQQRAHEAHSISFVGAVLSCGALTWTAHHEGNIPALLLAGFGVQASFNLIVFLILKSRGILTTKGLSTLLKSEWRPLLGVGGLFLVLQIGTMIGWGSDHLLLGSVQGAASVAVLAVAQRLFQFISQPVAVFNSPLWAAYADAQKRGDKEFMRRTLRWSMLISIAGAGCASTLLFLLYPWLIHMWTGDAVIIPWTLIVALAVWTTIEAGGNAFAMYLNGAGLVREQVIVVAAFCLVALPSKHFGALHIGATGVVIGTTIAYLLAVVLLYATILRSRVLLPLRDNAPL